MKSRQFGKYVVDQKIGRGGMGTVFRAHSVEQQDINPLTGKPLQVALKILNSSQESASEAQQLSQRFEKEIAALRMLNHPNIVCMLGFGVQDNVLFYAMELVEGPSLFDLLRNGRRFSVVQVLSIAKQLASAVSAAHAHGIIHRDIKPGNILLAVDDETSPVVKLTDFGVARVFNSQPMTSIGNILGTIQYMAPEQAKGLPVGPQADLYSLGAVLYALLSGHPPFSGRTIPDILRQHASESLQPIIIDGQALKPDFWLVLEQLLKMEASQRIPTALALQKRLETIDLFAVSEDNWGEERDCRNDDLSSDTSSTTISLSSLSRLDINIPHDDNTISSQTVLAFPEKHTPNNYTDVNHAEPQRMPRFAWIPAFFWTLAFVAFVVWVSWFIRPLTPEQAYRRIQNVPQLGSELRGKRIDQFLAMYPDDPHCKQVKLWKEELEVDRFEKRMAARLAGKFLTETDSLLERQYLYALQNADISLEEGIEQFQAISDFYEMPEFAIKMNKDDFDKRICLRSVVRKITKLKEKADEERPETEQTLIERLEQAQRLQSEGDAEGAQNIYKSVVVLFQNYPRFEKQVRAANQALQIINAAAADPKTQ